MPARRGQDYIDALKRMTQTIYLNGKLVKDVTEEPAFRGTIESVAQLYDLQYDPRYSDFALYESPTTGDPVSTSFLIPYSREDLIKKRQLFKLRTDHNFGFMGRTMDFMNMLVTGWYGNRARFATRGERFGENAANYYELVRENDLFLTHVLIAPQTDRSKTSAEQEDPYIHLGRVGETDEGIIVRGAKMLGTMAPITDEIYVMPFGGIAPGDDAYAVTFAIPTDAPGLKLFCREPVAVQPNNRFDHPLSSRFEEMDCIAVFEDVLVPWDRVIVDGGPGSGEFINNTQGGGGGGGVNQPSARMLSQMEFMCGLAMKVADCTGITGFLHVQEKLGEMLSELEVARGVFYGSEALASELPDGTWAITSISPRAFHLQTMRIYRRYVEIIQLLAAGGFFQAPAEADMLSEEERPYIDKYFRGRPGVSAEERIRIFKLAWDVTGTAFAQRIQQYVTYYSGDPIRLKAGFYTAYDKQPLFDIVDRALGKTDDLDIPVSPVEAAMISPRPTVPPKGMAGQYPATSLPRPTANRGA
jgi:anthranilate 3-monooxygenase (FAD)/4-hydroxyphenylacetate 3-monooxygenase